MCGIVGYHFFQEHAHTCEPVLRGLRTMRHRGPDDEGITLIDPERASRLDFVTEDSAAGVQGCVRLGSTPEIPHRVCFGHRRFSIIDLSPSAHQPFWSTDGRVCMAFNGEIYNYVELREELERAGRHFRTTSDSEVLVQGYQEWGVECFSRFNGFWAVSLYDTERRQTLLARDRIGKAPLYVTRTDDGIYWSSEIKGLMAALGSARFTVRSQAVLDFAKFARRDLFHETFFNEIESFPAASYAWLGADGRMQPVQYWTLPTERLGPREVSPDEAAARLRRLLEDAVRVRLRADVPVAVQLSGGMDSSTLVALVAQNTAKFDIFTVAFSEPEANEERYARAVADYYRDQVNYTVIEPPDEDLLVNADAYIHLMGEPFHSPNQFTNQRVWQTLADRGYRVNIYGAGGDEVLAGYANQYYFPYLRGLLRRGRPDRYLRALVNFKERTAGPLGVDLLLRAAMTIPGSDDVYRMLFRNVPSAIDPLIRPDGVAARRGPSSNFEQKMIDFMTNWQMNYWLRIDNQNSMGVPLEIRSPFLDYRVVEFAYTMPMEVLIRDGWMKWLLRRAMEDLLPHEVVWRRQKMGFPFPIQSWLGRSRESLLSMIEPLDCPYLDMAKLRNGYEALRRKNANYLWGLLSIALWWKRCIANEALALPAPARGAEVPHRAEG